MQAQALRWQHASRAVHFEFEPPHHKRARICQCRSLSFPLFVLLVYFIQTVLLSNFPAADGELSSSRQRVAFRFSLYSSLAIMIRRYESASGCRLPSGCLTALPSCCRNGASFCLSPVSAPPLPDVSFCCFLHFPAVTRFSSFVCTRARIASCSVGLWQLLLAPAVSAVRMELPG